MIIVIAISEVKMYGTLPLYLLLKSYHARNSSSCHWRPRGVNLLQQQLPRARDGVNPTLPQQLPFSEGGLTPHAARAALSDIVAVICRER